MKILSQRPSSRNPEVVWTIREFEGGRIVCDCPACFNGGECREMQNIRAVKEYHEMLQVKHQISDIKLPDKQQQIKEQWEYVLCRKRMIERQKTPEQILAERQNSLAIWQLYKRTSDVVSTMATGPMEYTEQPKPLYRLARTSKNIRSAD